MKRLVVALVFFAFVFFPCFATEWSYVNEAAMYKDAKRGVSIGPSGVLSGTFSNDNGIKKEKLTWSVSINTNRNVTFILYENGQFATLSTATYTTDLYDVTLTFSDKSSKTYSSFQIAKDPLFGIYCMLNSSNNSSFILDFLTHQVVYITISNDKGTYDLGSLNLSSLKDVFYSFCE